MGIPNHRNAFILDLAVRNNHNNYTFTPNRSQSKFEYVSLKLEFRNVYWKEKLCPIKGIQISNAIALTTQSRSPISIRIQMMDTWTLGWLRPWCKFCSINYANLCAPMNWLNCISAGGLRENRVFSKINDLIANWVTRARSDRTTLSRADWMMAFCWNQFWVLSKKKKNVKRYFSKYK